MSNIKSDNISLDNLCVLLKEGDTQRPVIFFHPIGGTITSYSMLVHKIQGDDACYGVQSPSLAGYNISFDSVISMASFYTEQLLNKFSVTPLTLIGWSYGGILAYEVAHCMEERGHSFNDLIMIDACFDFPNHIAKYFLNFRENEETVLKLFLQDLIFTVGRATYFGTNKIESFTQAIEYFNSLNIFHIKTQEIPYFEKIYNAFKTNIHCLKTYSPSSLMGNANHIVAKTIVNNIALEPELWKKLTKGTSRFFSVSGTHYTIIGAGNLQVINLLNQLLCCDSIKELRNCNFYF